MSKTSKAVGQSHVNRTDLILILMVTIAWGFNYPIMKYAVKAYPPIAFRTWCFVIAIVVIGLILWKEKQSFRVPFDEWWKVGKLSLGTMVIWHFGLIFGVMLLQSGRAAIAGYTMPVWALLSSVVLYGSKFTWRSSLGVIFALCATLLLAVSESKNLLGAPWGLIIILSAAVAWGVGTSMMKHIHVSISNLLMTFWMMAICLVIFTSATLIFEYSRLRMPTFGEWLAILYAGLIALAFAYVAWFRVARKLPPVVSSLSVMLVPVVGVFSSAFFLGEEITIYDLVALALILGAMLVVLVPTSAKHTAPN